MKHVHIAVLLLFGFSLSVGCNQPKDEVLPDGTKLFGHLKLKDGTKKAARVERPDGEKQFDVTWFPDGTLKAGRAEFPTGQKQFDATKLPDGTYKAGRTEFPDGEKQFDVTVLPDGTSQTARDELPNGEKQFEVTDLPNGTKKIARGELPSGEKWFDVTLQANGVEKVGRVEFPDGRTLGSKESAMIVRTGVPFADESPAEQHPLPLFLEMYEKTRDEHFAVLGITTGQTLEEVNARLRPYGFKPLAADSDGLGGGCQRGTTSNPSVASLHCDTQRAKFDSAKSQFVEDKDYAMFYDMYFADSGGGRWVLTQFRFTSTVLKHFEMPIDNFTFVFGDPALRKAKVARWDTQEQVWGDTLLGSGYTAARFALFQSGGLYVQDSALIKKILG